MIRLSNGHEFEYMVSSGALAFDGKGWPWEKPLVWFGKIDPLLFTIVLKSVTRYPQRGNMQHFWDGPKVVKLLPNLWKPNGAVNAVGLTNMGIEKWIKWANRNCEYLSRGNFVSSIYSESPEELQEMAAMLNGLSLRAIEINASCPNTGMELEKNADEVMKGVNLVRKATKLPIILKLSVAQDYIKIAKSVEGIVEAISVNSVPWHIVFPNQESPLEKFGGGGVSGVPAQPFMWKVVNSLTVRTSIPMIGPVWDYDDIRQVRLFGAKAVSFGSVHIRYPWRPTAHVKFDAIARARERRMRL
jgi:dihydroorotate dehydrogenase